ncbi:MAG TPA: NAD-dependent epimerase/dehydratase family protein, partial [Candidatus Acidoferrales bacterium]
MTRSPVVPVPKDSRGMGNGAAITENLQCHDGGGKMRIAVLGGDGYCGWATALYLSKQGHSVAIVDNFIRRQWDHELGAQTLTPIRPLTDRLRVWQKLTGRNIDVFTGDVTDYDFLSSTIQAIEPEAVVHFAEQRSAPYS